VKKAFRRLTLSALLLFSISNMYAQNIKGGDLLTFNQTDIKKSDSSSVLKFWHPNASTCDSTGLRRVSISSEDIVEEIIFFDTAAVRTQSINNKVEMSQYFLDKNKDGFAEKETIYFNQKNSITIELVDIDKDKEYDFMTVKTNDIHWVFIYETKNKLFHKTYMESKTTPE
jgi:hypothetical protein